MTTTMKGSNCMRTFTCSRLVTGVVGIAMLSLAATQAISSDVNPARVYAAAAPATVLIVAVSPDVGGSGTGSIVDSKGLVLTNAHVIMDERKKAPHEQVFVFLKPERVSGRDKDNLVNRFKATVVGYQKALDLALLQIEGARASLPVMPMGDPSALTIGSRVLAIGHPEGGGLWSLTTGVISAEWKDYGGVPGWDIFQTETSLNRGNSGGPLVDEFGHQIGVNSFIIRQAKDGMAITSINFAIKSNVAKDWLAEQGVQVAFAPSPQGTPTAASIRQATRAGSKQPDTLVENQPEATPETGTGLPPLRPFSLDQLVKGFAQVEKDLGAQMDDMEAEIRKRR